MKKLKPCPFCGSEPKIIKSSILKLGYTILCQNEIGCGAIIDGDIVDDTGTANYLTLKQIIERWNRRT
jgi:hypothetical protein